MGNIKITSGEISLLSTNELKACHSGFFRFKQKSGKIFRKD
jgi:hypothetical protein